MELDDCSFPELHSVRVCSDMSAAVSNSDYIIILDHLDLSSHPERFKLLKAVNEFYKGVAAAIKGSVKPDAKVDIAYDQQPWRG